MTTVQYDELKELIQTVVREELKNYEHRCYLNLKPKDAQSIRDYVSVATALGDGEVIAGIEVIRDNHKWLRLQRERSDKLSGAFIALLLTALVGALATALWSGIKQAVKQ